MVRPIGFAERERSGPWRPSKPLTIRLDACRYPTDNPTSDAEAHLTITETDVPAPVFDGWMIASSPGLSALDHPRYDVWVLRCVTPEAAPEADPATSEGEGE